MGGGPGETGRPVRRWTRLTTVLTRGVGFSRAAVWPEDGGPDEDRHSEPSPGRRWAVLLAHPLQRRRIQRERAAAVGSRLRMMRETIELSQEQVARKAGISLDFYIRLESGAPSALNRLAIDIVWAVADALRCSPAELFRGVD